MIFDQSCYIGEDFSNIDALPETIGHIRFEECRFNGLSFAETKLSGTVFDRCSFDFTRITGRLDKCAFLNCTFRYASLLGAEFDGCKMTGSSLANLKNASFTMDGGDWSYTMLRGLRVRRLDLRGINFTGANLMDCTFEGCDLTDARFDNAIVNALSLKNSDLSGASFDYVNFHEIDLKGCSADVDFAIRFTRAHGIKL